MHGKIRLEDYHYSLPEELIVQEPAQRREDSRLLVFNPRTQSLKHQLISNLTDLVMPGDCLVVNDSKVIPARVWGRKVKTGKKVEFLWLEEENIGMWRGLLRGHHPIGSEIDLGKDGHRAIVFSKNEDGSTTLKIRETIEPIPFLTQYGHIPLPPYIVRNPEEVNPVDQKRYQTIFANEYGSVAAPTAGLHFSHNLMSQLKEKGITIVPVTLHVGLGTFQPVKEEALQAGRLHKERFEITEESAKAINEALQNKRRIIVTGTTTCRVLESSAQPNGQVRAGKGATDLFIRPPFTFKIVKNLLTNFHLPQSSLIMLVASLVGRETLFKIYAEAIQEKYRFYSYGDAMLILGD